MPHFYWLKQLAVPVWRWDEMAVSPCPVARDYRLHLLHLPCHQSLSDDEMDWMLAALGKVLRTPVAGAYR
jgi:dTDP-4-amino-4,6-dideoxygalactose transaminase